MEDYTREQAEQVLKDWNEYIGAKGIIYPKDQEWLDHKFPQRVNGWYKTKIAGSEKWLAYYDFDKEISFGFDRKGNWHKINNTILHYPSRDYLASVQEVKDRLTAYAKELGFVKGVKYQSLTLETKWTFDGSYDSYIESGDFQIGADFIMIDGEWAKIVETVTLSQFPSDNFVTINGVKYVRQD